MVIAFANNQTMTAEVSSPSVISTDPVPLDDNDRASAVLNCHYIWKQGTAASIAYKAQTSMDGTTWIDSTTLQDTITAAEGAITKSKEAKGVYGAFIRFVFTLTSSGSAGQLAGVGFDLHVKLDHA